MRKIITVRMPEAVIEMIDAMQENINTQIPGMKVTRSEVINIAILRSYGSMIEDEKNEKL